MANTAAKLAFTGAPKLFAMVPASGPLNSCLTFIGSSRYWAMACLNSVQSQLELASLLQVSKSHPQSP